MDRGLVAVRPTQGVRELLLMAADFATGTGAELLLYGVVRPEEGVGGRMAEVAGREEPYRPGTEGSRAFAADLGAELVGDTAPYEVDSALGDPAEQVLAAVDRYDCDHLFATGRKRSPAGKAVFGDETQHLLLETDVPVSLVMT